MAPAPPSFSSFPDLSAPPSFNSFPAPPPQDDAARPSKRVRGAMFLDGLKDELTASGKLLEERPVPTGKRKERERDKRDPGDHGERRDKHRSKSSKSSRRKDDERETDYGVVRLAFLSEMPRPDSLTIAVGQAIQARQGARELASFTFASQG